MSTKNLIVSDLSGRPDAVPTSFGYAGTWYEIDLTAAEYEELERCMSAYLDAARRVGTAVVKPLPQRFVPDTTPVERSAIRVWARENGHRLSSYGQIPNAIHSAYAAAHAEAAS